jgi:hypothetical protein
LLDGIYFLKSGTVFILTNAVSILLLIRKSQSRCEAVTESHGSLADRRVA